MKVALLFFLLGILAGCLYGVLKFVTQLFKNNIFIQFITDILFSLSVGFSFLIAINHHFYGEIRIYIVAIFLLGMIIERKTLGKLFAKLYLILYNVGRKSIQKLKTTRFGKIIFK